LKAKADFVWTLVRRPDAEESPAGGVGARRSRIRGSASYAAERSNRAFATRFSEGSRGLDSAWPGLDSEFGAACPHVLVQARSRYCARR